jgi:hypothetical protein
VSYGFYIWYRVERDDADSERAVRGMQARLACRTGVGGRLLKKQGESRLWMEVYAGLADPAAFKVRLDQALAEFDIEMFIDGARHNECFEESDPVPVACTVASTET